ncbi:Lysophosphatidic acid phosphatase type 6 [Galdieria sulphuraria]|nr:Lysophosphatidic acid phosphatase type 6 [Galdieria sulphuraria]
MLNRTWVSCVLSVSGVITCINLKSLVYSDYKRPESDFPLTLPGELIFSQVIFRHGARSPVYEVKGDSSSWNFCSPDIYEKYLLPVNIVSLSTSTANPVEDDSKSQETTPINVCKRGQLTAFGVQQMVTVGGLFRKRYFEEFHLLDKQDWKNQIYVRSTFMKRAVQSAQAFLQGLLCECELQEGERVSIHVLDKKDENLFPNSYQCPRIKELYAYGRKLLSENKEKFIMPELAAGYWNLQSPLDFIRLRDVIISREAHGLPPLESDDGTKLPHEEVVERGHRAMSHLVLGYNERTRNESLKLSGGLLLKELLEHMKESVQGKQSYRCLLYSGHDTSLVPLLCMLQIYNDEWPPFGSFLAFELYRNSKGEHYVGIYYNGQRCSLPSCGNRPFCPWEEFERQMSPFLLQDSADVACQPSKPLGGPEEMRTTYA